MMDHCKDCLHYQHRLFRPDECFSPSNGVDRVTGNTLARRCDENRASIWLCGPQSEWFRPAKAPAQSAV